MRLHLQSRIWPVLTVPTLAACLAVGVSLVVSMESGRRETAEWAGCEAGLRSLNGRLWEQQEALERGESGGGRAKGQAVRRALESLPPSCFEAAQRSRLRADVTGWLAAVEGDPAGARRNAWQRLAPALRQIDSLTRVVEERAGRAASGALSHRAEPAALCLLAIVLAALALLLNRTYRRELQQRQLAERGLRESEKRYRELFEHVAEGVYQTSAEGAILRANSALVAMLGFESEDELRRVNVGADLYCDPAQRRELTAQLEREGYLREAELSLKRRDGTQLVVLENARAVRGPDGALLWYEGSLIDITARKKAENALAAQMRELEEARTQSEQQAYQLLEQSFELARARDQALQGAGRKLHFLVNLSSEFRAPMKGVASMAQMLLDSDLSLQQREFAESVKKAAGRLLETIDEILDYSRIDAGEVKFERKEFSLRALVADLLHGHAARAEEKGLELATLVKRDVPDALVGDAGRLRQVMSHLLHNAIRMSDSGTVSLTINAVQGNAQEVMLRVQVEDCGAGIPPEVMPVLFDPFARGLGARERTSGGSREAVRDGARERGGSGGGMSLAISKRLVERLGGQMGVESEPGQGSLFWFQVSFPRAAADAEPGVVLAGQRCLIVHDGVSVRGAMAEMLGNWGMQAVTASDGPQALAMLRQAELLRERFDVLLVDSELPGSPGVALADAVIEDPGCGRPDIVLLVPYSQRAHCAEPTFVGISALLPKPVEERALRACLARLQAREPRPAHALTHSLHQLHEATRGESGKRVLLVDDDPIGRRVGQRLLEKLGYEAVVAMSGREAVQAVQEGRFAAVLMDMMMPELDGCAATRTIRELAGVDRALPIIAMTASDAASHRERCLAAGMNDFLCKPATLDELRTVLQRWTTIDREAATV